MREGKIALVNFIRDNIRAKKVAKVIDKSVGKVIKEVTGFGGDIKGATHCYFPVSQQHFPVHQISKDSNTIIADNKKDLSEDKIVVDDFLAPAKSSDFTPAQEGNDNSNRDRDIPKLIDIEIDSEDEQ